ncbi:hypothetical protein ACFOUW_31540 [Tenggerimyces flavus]|uniref:GHMP kinase N-terminal domain-containing protein n=1 Tax=Tenggerimyces flavus TaxID=1708749 RepID=A0ABV7YJT1_9ACTN
MSRSPYGQGAIRVVAPLKAGLAGGGSDLPSYYEASPGQCLNLALDIAVTVTYTSASAPGQASFTVPEPADVRLGTTMVDAVGLTRTGDVHVRLAAGPGRGLGCSSALAVALVMVQRALSGLPATPGDVAEAAWRLEACELAQPVGKQDHYASAFGGVNEFSFRPEGVGVHPLRLSPPGAELLENSLLVASVGEPRTARDTLSRQNDSCRNGVDSVRAAIAERVRLVPEFRTALAAGDHARLARLMRYDWSVKAGLDPGMYDVTVEAALAQAVDVGALAARLLGAGRSGYLLLLAPPGRRDAIVRVLGAHFRDVRPVRPSRRGVWLGRAGEAIRKVPV